MTPTNPNKIELLSSDIGRGHPFYLDGIDFALKKKSTAASYETVFSVSTRMSLLAWKGVRWLYRHGSSHRLVKDGYQALRKTNDYNNNSLMLSILSLTLREKYQQTTEPLVVDHPVLVAALRGRKNLYYQHGELVVPSEALVKGDHTVFVPTNDAASKFIDAGFAKEKIIVTGLCIEPELVRQSTTAYEQRLERLSHSSSLTGAFFSSGAEPKEHVVSLVRRVISAVQNGHTAIVFAKHNGQFKRAIKKAVQTIDTKHKHLIDYATFATRSELDMLTAQAFAKFDFFVSPSHERSNWAMGLGLPMFIVEPCIGTFSPLNRALLVREKVAVSLGDSQHSFADRLASMRQSGELAAMAKAGWGKYTIDGFDRIASFLASAARPI